jgi:hypothetical protein
MFNQIGFGVRGTNWPNTPINLPAGAVYTVPSGQYSAHLGPYTAIQQWDGVSQIWRFVEASTQSAPVLLSSDGFNVRLINMTSTVVGAVITNAGTGYTNGIYLAGTGLGTAASPSCTFTAGGGRVLATGTVIVGGAINTTVTITTAGSNYIAAPTLLISAPPAGGVQATATCTISAAGVVNAVTVTNQGAGYTAVPTITVVNSNGDTTGTGAVLTINATLAGSGTVTAITIANNGAGMTSVPTISFSPASTTAATAVMCVSMLTSATTGGTGYTNAATAPFVATSNVTAGTPIYTNPAISTGVFVPRPATGFVTCSSTTAWAATLTDNGLFQVASAYTGVVPTSAAFGTTTGTVANTFGGVSDTVYLQTV